MKHRGTVDLVTDRLILRRFKMTDAADCYENWTGDDEVTKFLRWPTHSDLTVTERVIASWVDSYDKYNFYQWAIVEKESEKVVGVISAVDLDEKLDIVHIGYALGSRWWNRGYVTEAFDKVIEFFFEEVEANRIESQHDPDNPASGRVMQKCGLKYEGTLRERDWSNRGIVDAAMYAILRKEYRK